MIRMGGLLGLLAWGLLLPASGSPQGIRPGDAWRYALLADTPPPTDWQGPSFDDAHWGWARGGFSAGYSGYQQAATALPTSLPDGPVRRLLQRCWFTIEDPSQVGALLLRVEYQDGLAVWLNGTEVLRMGWEAGLPPGNARLPGSHPAGAPERIDLSAHLPLLQSGSNLLSVLVENASPFGGSVFCWVELRADFARGPLIQNVSQREATVVWQAPAGGTAWVEWAPADGPGLLSTAGQPTGEGQSVVLGGLEPGRRYRYRVVVARGERVVRSDFAEFTALRDDGEFTFLVIGDSGAGIAPGYEVADLLAREPPDLVLHTGDVVYPTFTTERVDLRYFSRFEDLLREVPVFPTLGNHDVAWNEADYLESFHLPTNSVTGTEHFYSFNHGDAHFVSLYVPLWYRSNLGRVDDQGQADASLRWLWDDLAASTKPWKFVFFHQPMRTSGPHRWDDYDLDGRRDSEQILETLLPVLSAHGVQLVFHGHDHFWERFAPTNGVHTLVTGGGGAFLYSVSQREPASARVISAYHATRVRLREGTLQVEALGVSGERLDAFVIRSEPLAHPTSGAFWHTPSDPPGVSNGDGNQTGERFDLIGPGVPGVAGQAANLGELLVNEDRGAVYLGLRGVMLWPGQTLALFLATPRLPGIATTRGVGADRGHPLADLALEFDGFRPALVGLLGDEWADATDPRFGRPGAFAPLGQGVFALDTGLSPVSEIGLRQFNRSPEGPADGAEQNADHIILTLPRGLLGGVLPGDTLRLGAVVLTPGPTGSGGIGLGLDTAYLGAEFGTPAPGLPAVLRPVSVILGPAPGEDPDLDGLPSDQELAWGTDPQDPDSDDDGLPDGWEVAHQLNPRGEEGGTTADADPDGDGYTNLEEYRSGTDPHDPAPTLRLWAEPVAKGLRLRWTAMIGRQYEVEFADHLPGEFQVLPRAGFPSTARTTNATVIIEAPKSLPATRWFRVRELPRPAGPAP